MLPPEERRARAIVIIIFALVAVLVAWMTIIR